MVSSRRPEAKLMGVVCRLVQLDITAPETIPRQSVALVIIQQQVQRLALLVLQERIPIVSNALRRSFAPLISFEETCTQGPTNCKAVQGGYKANTALAATAQVACGVGYYSPGSTAVCTICPAGQRFLAF
jgi:hypothetical protein